MTTEIKDGTFLWVSCIFVILANLAVTFVLHLFKIPHLKKLSQPLIISMFLLEAIRKSSISNDFGNSSTFYGSNLMNTKTMLISLIILIWIALDILLFKSKENENINVSENNEDEENANDKKFDPNNFDYSTAFFVVIMWVTYMMNGITDFIYMKGSNEGNLQQFFYFVLRFATLQFVYGMYVLNQNVSRLFYLIYMIPQAILWPLASIISYYVHQEKNLNIYKCESCFNSFMSGSLYFLVFKIYYQCPEYINDEIKDKGFHLIFLIIGLAWYGIVHRIGNISNETPKYD